MSDLVGQQPVAALGHQILVPVPKFVPLLGLGAPIMLFLSVQACWMRFWCLLAKLC